MIETWVYRNKIKLPTSWACNISKEYERDTIKAELHRAKRISSNFTNEVTLIRNKFKSASYPMHFVNNLMHEFTTTQTNEGNEFIIPPWLFEGQNKIFR